MKTDFLMILTLVILQSAPGLGATKVVYRTKKKVYVAFTAGGNKSRGLPPSGEFLTASLHENERVLQIRDEPIPDEALAHQSSQR